MELNERITALSEELKRHNLPEIGLVSPGECRPRDMNARYMDQTTMDTLVRNLKRDGRLESVPLLFRNADGQLEILSGHHRIEAAKRAGIEKILVMVTTVRSDQEAVAKQLSHNAIVGKDDAFTLQKLYDLIGEVDLKVYSGLTDSLKDIGIESVSFAPKLFAEFSLFMADGEIEKYDEVAKRLEEAAFRADVQVRVIDLRDEERFRDLLARVKKRENIKSNAVAFNRLVACAEEWLVEHGEKTSRGTPDKADPEDHR
jgi:ASC-1-like (ASCH) protein